MKRRLSVTNHDRDVAGFTYVYPVVSRRAGGVSIGVNLNPNNACNWRCAYCQVPNLVRGAAPPIELSLLVRELGELLSLAQDPGWLTANAPEGFRRVVDVAVSGNGEPTTCSNLDEVLGAVLETLRSHGPPGPLAKVIISNGSMVDRPVVKRALTRWNDADGEVWFKVDAGTEATREKLNGTSQSDVRSRKLLTLCSGLIRTRIQTCVVAWDGAPPPASERAAYIDFLARAIAEGAKIHDILLYGIARESHQPEASRIDHPGEAWLQEYGEQIEAALARTVHVRA
jgi:wyosine [tRNA(Phe)-imidazoG37] synthetase (radical SAM superfamily)